MRLLKKIFKYTSFSFAIFFLPSIKAQTVGFRVNLSPVGSFQAESSQVKGKVQKSADVFKASDVILSLDTLKTGLELRDSHMKKKYFEIEKFPNATLSAAEGKDGKFKAQLEIHGIKKEIQGTYEVKENLIKANFKTKMSDFSIPKASYLGVGAKDEVEVEITLPVVEGK